MLSIKLSLGLAVSLLALPSFAAKNAGVLTSVSGNVEVFIKPSKSPSGQKPRVMFENTYYTSKKAKVGRKLKFNHVVKTSPKAKAKITFNNGDTMMIGPGSALSLQTLKEAMTKKNKDGQTMNLIYGKVRAIISKKGPRKNMRVKTKTAVAGVRGTDFYVRYNGSKDSTEVSVLRGKVAVNTKNNAAVRATRLLKKGYFAEVRNIKEIPNQLPEMNAKPKKGKGMVMSQKVAAVAGFEKPIEIRVLSKERIENIDTETTVKKAEATKEELAPEVKKVVEALDKKALEVVIEDIKAEDPEQFKKIQEVAKSDGAAEKINSAVLDTLQKSAPEEIKARKISEDELLKNLDSGEDVYKKYFQ